MTWTNWKSPRQQQYVESDEVQFKRSQTGGVLTSARAISGRGNFYGELITTESTAIAFTDFGFELNGKVVEEIELFLHVSRLGRTQDKVIKLWTGEKPFGKNRADLSAEDENTYSGRLKDWELATAKNVPYESSDFGAYVDLQPHTEYPSSVTVYIRNVKMRLKLVDPVEP